MADNASTDLVAEDLTEQDWEPMVRYLVGDDPSGTEVGDIQACCGGACACACDDCTYPCW